MDNTKQTGKDTDNNELNPSHYRKGVVQPIDLIQSFNLPFELGNVVKYVCRFPDKGGYINIQKSIIYLLLFAKRYNIHEQVLEGCLKYYEDEIKLNDDANVDSK